MSGLPESLLHKIRKKLSFLFKESVTILSLYSVSGGCINMCYMLKTNFGCFFIKYNKDADSDMFSAEAKGFM